MINNFKHKIIVILMLLLVVTSSTFILIACNKIQSKDAKAKKLNKEFEKCYAYLIPEDTAENIDFGSRKVYDSAAEILWLKRNTKACKNLRKEYDKESPVEVIKLPNLNRPKGIDHYQVLLQNGQVLIMDDQSIEVYNPLTNKFTILADNLPEIYKKRTDLNFYNRIIKPIILQNGDIYFAGMIIDHNNLQLKNGDQITKKIEEILINKYRSYFFNYISNHGSILPDGKMVIEQDCKIILGAQYCNKFLLVDPLSNKKYKAGEINTRLAHINRIYFSNNKIFLFGGYKEGQYYPETRLQIYNAETGKIDNLGDLKFNNLYPRVLILNNTQLLFLDDIIPRVFDIDKKAFINKIKPLNLKYLKNSAINKNNIILTDIISGQTNRLKLSIFDIKTFKTKYIKNIMLNRAIQQYTILNNGNILVTGGPAFPNYACPFNFVEEKCSKGKDAYLLKFKDRFISK